MKIQTLYTGGKYVFFANCPYFYETTLGNNSLLVRKCHKDQQFYWEEIKTECKNGRIVENTDTYKEVQCVYHLGLMFEYVFEP